MGLASQSTTSFTLQVTGFSTTRSLTKLNFQFAAASGATVASLSVDVSAAATNWYNSIASQAFGGQFAVSIPFSSTTSLVGKIQSVAVTASNAQGTSKSVNLSIIGP